MHLVGRWSWEVQQPPLDEGPDDMLRGLPSRQGSHGGILNRIVTGSDLLSRRTLSVGLWRVD